MAAEISSERLDLNTISIEDYAFIQELVNTKGWLDFIGDRNVHSPEDARSYINKIRNTVDLRYWVVRNRATQEAIGIVSFLKRSYLDHFDLGFAFLPQYQGHGYAFEASLAVLQFLKANPVHRTVLATCLPANKRSISLLLKLGFHFMQEKEVDGEIVHIFTYDTQVEN